METYELKILISNIAENNKEKLKNYSTNKGLLWLLVGTVMKETKNIYNPLAVNNLSKEILEENY